MNIGIDTYPRMIFATGVRVVIDNVLIALREAFPQHRFIELHPAGQAYDNRGISRAEKALNHARRVAWTQFGLPRAARKAQCDVLLCTCHFSPFIRPMPTVTVFYDFAIWRHPDWFPRYWVLMNKLFAEWPARGNSQLITISEDSRQDALRIIGLPADRVSAVALGVNLSHVDPSQDLAVLAGHGIDPTRPYVLYFGAIAPHKNIPRLIEAFVEARERLPEPKPLLVLAGPRANAHGQDETAAVQATIDRAGASEHVCFTGWVPREHCTILYRNAAVFAFPSMFEGFGLPIIEAMSCGAPVVASRCTSLPEVGGEAALYFDPLDPHDMADALCTVLNDADLRRRMAFAGQERARAYTWRNTAVGVMGVLERAAAEGSK